MFKFNVKISVIMDGSGESDIYQVQGPVFGC